MDIPEDGTAEPTPKRRRPRVEDLMGKEQSQDSIFVDNPFVDGFLEWMGLP
jgi:hypothetical protein